MTVEAKIKPEYQARADKRKEQSTALRKRLASDMKAAGITTDLAALRKKHAAKAAQRAAKARRRHKSLKAARGNPDMVRPEPGEIDEKK